MGNPQAIRVLLYHRIGASGERSHDRFTIAESALRKQIELLDRWGYRTITFDDFRLFEAGRINLPPKPVIITFDDAYAEIYSVAFPILRSYGMRAVVFALGDLSIRRNAWDDSMDESSRLLDQKQLLELHAVGFEIGSHSMTHPLLTDLGREEAWQEISRSRMAMEILLNAPVRSFAYPYGATNAMIKQLVSQAGYDVGCAAYSGTAWFGDDPLEIRRILVLDTSSPAVFWFQLHQMYAIYRWLVWCVKRIYRYVFPRKR